MMKFVQAGGDLRQKARSPMSLSPAHRGGSPMMGGTVLGVQLTQFSSNLSSSSSSSSHSGPKLSSPVGGAFSKLCQ